MALAVRFATAAGAVHDPPTVTVTVDEEVEIVVVLEIVVLHR